MGGITIIIDLSLIVVMQNLKHIEAGHNSVHDIAADFQLTWSAELIWCHAMSPTSVNFFSNWIGSLSFYPIFLISGLYVHNNIDQNPWNWNFTVWP